MSKEKRRNKDRRAFVLANLPIGDDMATRRLPQAPTLGRKPYGWMDVSKEVKWLEKRGLIKRKRILGVTSKPHVGRTVLVKP